MIVFVNDDLAYRLKEPHNFRQFNIEIMAPKERLNQLRKTLADLIEFDSDSIAWVSAAGLQALPPVRDDAAWGSGFTQMIDKARPHGWIRDRPKLAIKAHVVWAKSTTVDE